MRSCKLFNRVCTLQAKDFLKINLTPLSTLILVLFVDSVYGSTWIPFPGGLGVKSIQPCGTGVVFVGDDNVTRLFLADSDPRFKEQVALVISAQVVGLRVTGCTSQGQINFCGNTLIQVSNCDWVKSP